MSATTMRQPVLFIPHGGGPCFFMDDPGQVWKDMGDFLRGMAANLPAPKAILVVSAHWETRGFAFTGAARPPLLYDYYNFPKHTYELRYDAPGAPWLAARAAALLVAAGLPATIDEARGLDHGVFIPLKVAYPEAAIPVVEMSLALDLDPATHLAAGRALAPLRDEGVLIIGSGMSFHNLRQFADVSLADAAEQFDTWLTGSLAAPAPERDARLTEWAAAPGARVSHPREEHLLPLMVAAGAAEGPGEKIYAGHVMKKAVSAFRFD
jgi:aromatic ring-opening dioxygenase catalytic subunit (LigB family)